MNEKTPLARILSAALLRSLAGGTTYERGEEYVEQGAVRELRVMPDAVRALVDGSAPYRVVLRAQQNGLAADCSCRHAGDGYFCKHCVAVGLACLAERGGPAAQPAGAGPDDPMRTIQSYLHTLPSDSLVALLLDVAQRDERLSRALLLQARRGADSAQLAATLRKAIDDATALDGHVAWDKAGELAHALDELADAMAELLQPASSVALVELLEYAIERMESMLEDVDDSDGGISEVVARLAGLHLEACGMAALDPIELAERLFQLEMTLPMGIARFGPRRYREVLGDYGMERYRSLATERWRTLAPRAAGDAHNAEHFAITGLMEELAQDSGDIEQLVAVKARDLSSSYRYVEIAELWREAGRLERAVEWAERGMAAFPDGRDIRLCDCLVALYQACGRHEQALELAWGQFERHPGLSAYQKLAGVAAPERWPAMREQALAAVDAMPRQHDFLRLTIALWEDDLDTAWRYAGMGACNHGLLIELAGKLEATRPDDAVALYRRVVPALLEKTSNAGYADAVALVGNMARALERHQRRHELDTYLAFLRTEFKRKRNFITLLDRFASRPM